MNEAISILQNKIVNPTITFFFVLGLVVFGWGIVQFIIASQNADAGGVEEGKRHMVWGIIGLAIIVGVFGIMNVVKYTVQSF